MTGKPVDALLEEGRRHVFQGDFTEARSAYAEAERLCRESGDAARRARLLGEIGRSLMEAFFRLAVPRAGAWTMEEYEQAVTLSGRVLDYPHHAIEYLRRALEIEPDHAGTHAVIGDAYDYAGRPDSAVAAYRCALELQPGLLDVQIRLASLLISKKRGVDPRREESDEAIRMLRQVVAARPDDLDARQRLVDAMARTGQTDDAVREFVEFVKVRPEWSQMHYDLVNGCVQATPAGTIRDAFERMATTHSAPALCWYGLGLACQSEGDQRPAIAAYRKGIEIDSGFAPLAYNLGNALKADDQVEEAIRWLEKAVAMSDTFAEPRFALGITYLQRNPREAGSHLRAFLDLAPPYLAGAVGHARMALMVLHPPPQT